MAIDRIPNRAFARCRLIVLMHALECAVASERKVEDVLARRTGVRVWAIVCVHVRVRVRACVCVPTHKDRRVRCGEESGEVCVCARACVCVCEGGGGRSGWKKEPAV